MYLRSIAIMFTMFSIGAVSALGASALGEGPSVRTFTATQKATESPSPIPTGAPLIVKREDMCRLMLPLSAKECRHQNMVTIGEKPYSYGICLVVVPNGGIDPHSPLCLPKPRETSPTLEEALNSLSYPLYVPCTSTDASTRNVFSMLLNITSPVDNSISELYIGLAEFYKDQVACRESRSAVPLSCLKP